MSAAGLFAAAFAVSSTFAWSQYRAWSRLEHDGVVAPAELVGASHYTKASDRIRVAFATEDGKLIEASVPIGELSRYRSQMTVMVRYDPANPRRVRTLDDWSPPYVWTALTAALLGAVAVAILWRAWRWPRRLRRVATSRMPGRRMILHGVIAQGRVQAPWAVLHEGARPVLAFRLADTADLPPEPVEVEVVGDVRRRGVAVAFGPRGVVWPAGKLRKPPKRTSAVGAPPGDAGRRATGVPEHPGALPALPPEVLERLDRRKASPVRFVMLAPAMLIVVALPQLPDVIESHRRVCRSPPEPRAGGPPASGPDELFTMLPADLAGFILTKDEVRRLGSFDNPPTQIALEDAGFQYGARRQFQNGTTHAQVSVSQFGSERGALRFEAQRFASQCAERQRAFALPAGTGAVGVIFAEADDDRARLSFIRGSRVYTIIIDARDFSGKAHILLEAIAVAR